MSIVYIPKVKFAVKLLRDWLRDFTFSERSEISEALWETTFSTCFSKTMRRSSMFCSNTEVVSFKSGTSTLKMERLRCKIKA
jgi:hypothetical protein